MALFTADTHFVVYMNVKDRTPSQESHSRAALAAVFADLNKYDATMHFVGQRTILSLTGDQGTGETYCLAHHLTVEGDKRRLDDCGTRYYDTFVKGTQGGCSRSGYCTSTGLRTAFCHDRDEQGGFDHICEYFHDW